MLFAYWELYVVFIGCLLCGDWVHFCVLSLLTAIDRFVGFSRVQRNRTVSLERYFSGLANSRIEWRLEFIGSKNAHYHSAAIREVCRRYQFYCRCVACLRKRRLLSCMRIFCVHVFLSISAHLNYLLIIYNNILNKELNVASVHTQRVWRDDLSLAHNVLRLLLYWSCLLFLSHSKGFV